MTTKKAEPDYATGLTAHEILTGRLEVPGIPIFK
jgi:hypothetical protein